jgi:hypothetical protein
LKFFIQGAKISSLAHIEILEHLFSLFIIEKFVGKTKKNTIFVHLKQNFTFSVNNNITFLKLKALRREKK